MPTPPSSFAILSDRDLLQLAKQLAAREREATVALIASLMEIDARRLYLGEGCSSLFIFCTRVLHLSEHAAYHRIEAARAARRFPVILDLLADGSMTLTNVTLLAPHLTADNAEALLAAARFLDLEPMHGYGIGVRIEQITRGVFKVNAGSLFPALRRLERDGLIKGDWRGTEHNRRARWYALTAAGRKRLDREVREWESSAAAIAAILRVQRRQA